jgi:glyoxylase-like metal-dependent hydrolase (beta-lactamase superfamily II)
MEKIIPGVPVTIAPGIVRITAPNPGVMTGPGTNSYVVGESELVLIDPGPDIASHVDVLRRAVGDRLKWILCTHTHLDHSPAARALKNATGARVAGRIATQDGRQDAEFAPDRVLSDGDSVTAGNTMLRAVHTPGHASNHLCYVLEEQKLIFTGDHIVFCLAREAVGARPCSSRTGTWSRDRYAASGGAPIDRASPEAGAENCQCLCE